MNVRITKREISFWTNFLISTALLFGVLVMVNFLSSRYYFLKDLTEERIHTLSDQTIKILNELDKKAKSDGKELKILAFMKENEPQAQEFQNLMKQYSYRSKSIKWEIIDPERKPQLATLYDIKTFNSVVFIFGDKKIKTEINFDAPDKSPESIITSNIYKFIGIKELNICFTEGHGERDPNDTSPTGVSKLAKYLKDEGYNTIKIRLWEQGSLTPCDIIMIIGPQRSFTQVEITNLSEYLAIGGRAVIMLDPESKDFLNPILERWGIGTDNRLVVDPTARLFGAGPAMPVLVDYDKEHPITRGFNFGVISRVTRRVFIKSRVQGVDATEIARTSPNSWADSDWESGTVSFDPANDIKGPVPVVVAVQGLPGVAGGEAVYGTMQNPGTVQARLVVSGDSDLASDALIDALGNKDLILNSINWVAEKGELISIRPKELKKRGLYLTPSNIVLIRNIFLFVIPGTLLLISFIVYFVRKRL